MARRRHRQHTGEFKLAALARMDAAPNVQALARDLDIERALLYRWQRHYRRCGRGGAATLRNSGRRRPVLMHPSEAVVPAEETPAPAINPISILLGEEKPASTAVVPTSPAPSASLAVHDQAVAARRIAELVRKGGQQQLELDFLRSLAACQGAAPADRRAWRDGLYAVIHAQSQQQGEGLGIERSCDLAKLSRAGYYRHWLASKPKQEETALRDDIQRLSLANKHQGYRPITVLLKRSGWEINHKRVQRIRREDNLLCLSGRTFRPATTDGRHSWKIWPNLSRYLEPTTVSQLWVEDITYVLLD